MIFDSIQPVNFVSIVVKYIRNFNVWKREFETVCLNQLVQFSY